MASQPLPAPDDTDPRGPRGIQSIEVGGTLLLALAHHGRPMPLKDLARDAGMAPAKAHPYLVSFQKVGLVAQDAGSGHYGLGPLAMQMGLIGLQQYDPLRLATPLIEELAEATGLTVAVALWGNRGPTIVRVAEAAAPVHVTMRHGTVMSLRDTASGRLFAALMPDAQWRAVAGPEADALDRDPAFQAALAAVRAGEPARAEGDAVPGISALAVPVFDSLSRLVLCLTVVAPGGGTDLRAGGAVALKMQDAAQALSQRLGWKG